MDGLAIALMLVSGILAGITLVQTKWQSLLGWGLLALTVSMWLTVGPS